MATTTVAIRLMRMRSSVVRYRVVHLSSDVVITSVYRSHGFVMEIETVVEEKMSRQVFVVPEIIHVLMNSLSVIQVLKCFLFNYIILITFKLNFEPEYQNRSVKFQKEFLS